MSKVLSGIAGSIIASGLVYSIMNKIVVGTSLAVPQVLMIGTLIGFVAAIAIAITDRTQPQSMMHSAILGGATSLVTICGLIAWIMIAYNLPPHELHIRNIQDALEIASTALVGVGGAIGYRLVVDNYQRVRAFATQALASGIGAAVGLVAYGAIANYLALGATMLPNVLGMALIAGTVFGVLFAFVHSTTKPTLVSSIVTGFAFGAVALFASLGTGAFVGISPLAIVGLVVAPCMVGGGAYLGSRLRG